MVRGMRCGPWRWEQMTAVVHDGRPQILGNLCEERGWTCSVAGPFGSGSLGRLCWSCLAPLVQRPAHARVRVPAVSGLSPTTRPAQASSVISRGNKWRLPGIHQVLLAEASHCLPTMKGRKTGGKENVAVSNHQRYWKWHERKVWRGFNKRNSQFPYKFFYLTLKILKLKSPNPKSIL